MDWVLVFKIAVSIFVFIFLLYDSYSDGYKAGHRKGFEDGKRAVNEYLLKLNRALGERIEEMDSRK